jgi:hypothetical protein
VSGATTTAAAVNWGTFGESSNTNDFVPAGRSHLATVTAGSNVFTVQALASHVDDVATIAYPYVIVDPR